MIVGIRNIHVLDVLLGVILLPSPLKLTEPLLI